MENAPGLDGVEAWVNSEPRPLSALEGRQALVYFWTYSCAHCAQTISSVQQLREAYRDAGLQVVGVHSPEFSFEADRGNVEDAVAERGIDHPVALDTDNTVWKRYGNVYRPRQALIGPDGTIRHEVLGGGGHAALEEQLRRLIRRTGEEPGGRVFEEEQLPGPGAVSPDIYAGIENGGELGNDQPSAPHTAVAFEDAGGDLADGGHRMNRIYLDGRWRREDEYIVSAGDGEAAVRFAGSACSAVLGPEGRCRVELDGDPVPEERRGEDVRVEDGETVVDIDRPGLYRLVEMEDPGVHEITLSAGDEELRIYRYMFQ